MVATRHSLELFADSQNIILIEPYINQVIEDFRLDENIYGNILIAITEAVNNCIIHGNKEDHSKTVKIFLFQRTEKKQITFQISDEGVGFNYNNIPNPTLPENIMKLGGRGLFLIQQLSDGVTFLNNGSTIEINFDI